MGSLLSRALNGNNINTENCEILHSKAWDLLLQFHGLAVDSSPISRRAYLNRNTNKICIPLHPIKHKGILGHNSADRKFNNEVELETFPSETFKDIKMKLSGYAKLYTKYPIRLKSLILLLATHISLKILSNCPITTDSLVLDIT